MITFIKVYSEFNFESMHKNRDRIFMVEFSYGNMMGLDNIHQRPLLERFFETSPLIEQSLTMIPPFIKQMEFRIKDQQNNEHAFLSDVTSAEGSITDIFDFEIVSGDKNCLQDPQKLMIPASLAYKLFESVDVIGRDIRSVDKIWTIKDKQFTIGAVYKDFPFNTQLSNDIYMPMNPEYGMDGKEGRSCFGIVMLSSPGAASELCESFDPAVISNKSYAKDVSLRLIPLEDIYFHYEKPLVTKGGNHSTLYILICIGLLVLIIAIINHTNMMASLAPVRIRSINTQKVLGSSNSVIRFSLVVESIFLCSVAFLLSLFWIYFISQTEILNFIGLDLSIIKNIDLVLVTFIIACLLGLLSGLYPAYYMTSFSPALVLKGNFGLSASGKALRKLLVGFQLAITIALISATFFLYLQNRFMKNSEKGFDEDKIVLVSGNVSLMNAHKYEIADKLKTSPLISDVAFASDRFGASDVYNFNEVTTPADENILFCSIFISYNFFDVMGISVIDGHKPTINDQKSEKGVYVFNKLTKEQHQLQLLDELKGYRDYSSPVTAFINDVALTSKRIEDNEIGFFIQEKFVKEYAYYMYVRMEDNVNPLEVSNQIQKTFAEFDPTTIVNIEYYDSLTDRLYEKETNLERLILLLTFLTILLAVIGLFGLVLFEAQYKRKEIAVRKVFGAETREILFDLNKSYVKMVLCCSVISVPITYW
ncbi:MAG: FtsX-like permease family protein, partial [Bacteroidales bacterium]